MKQKLHIVHNLNKILLKLHNFSLSVYTIKKNMSKSAICKENENRYMVTNSECYMTLDKFPTQKVPVLSQGPLFPRDAHEKTAFLPNEKDTPFVKINRENGIVLPMEKHTKKITPLKWEFDSSESGLTDEETKDMNLLLQKIFDFGYHSVKDDKIYTLIPYIAQNAHLDLQEIIKIEQKFCEEFSLENYIRSESDMVKWILKSISELHPYVIHGLIKPFYQEACFKKSSKNKPESMLTAGKNILTQAIKTEIEFYSYKMQAYGFRIFCYILMFGNLKEVIVKALFSLEKDIIFLEWVGSWTSALYFFLNRRGPFYNFVNENDQDEIIQYTSSQDGTEIQCTKSISSLLKFDLNDYYKLIQMSWEIDVEVNGTWSKTKITLERKLDLKKFRDCVKKYFILLEEQFWFYNMKYLRSNETVKMFSDPAFEDLTKSAETIAGEHWTQLKQTVPEHFFYGEAFLKKIISSYRSKTRNNGRDLLNKQLFKMRTKCLNNPYFVNISTNIIEQVDDFENEEEYLKAIQEKIEKITHDIQENEKKIEEGQYSLKVYETDLSASEKTVEKLDYTKTKNEIERLEFSKSNLKNNEMKKAIKEKIKANNIKIRKYEHSIKETSQKDEIEKYKKKIIKIKKDINDQNDTLSKLEEIMSKIEEYKFVLDKHKSIQKDIDTKHSSMEKYISEQKEILIRKKELLKEYMVERKRIQEEHEKLVEEMLKAEKENAEKELVEKESLQKGEDEKDEEDEQDEAVSETDINQQSYKVKVEEENIFDLFKAACNQNTQHDNELEAARKQKELDKKKKEEEQRQRYENFIQDNQVKLVQNRRKSKKNVNPIIGNHIQLLDFITDKGNSKADMPNKSRDRPGQSAQELANWRLKQQETTFSGSKKSTSKTSNSNLPSTHTLQENSNTKQNVAHNQNSTPNSQIKVQTVDASKSFSHIAKQNIVKKTKVEPLKVVKSYNFKCTQCKYQCVEWDEMVSHIFNTEDHKALKERLEEIKDHDELQASTRDNFQSQEEIFKKAFTKYHIAAASSSYSVSNDYDRSDKNYYPANTKKSNNRRKIEGENGYDRAFRRQQNREGNGGNDHKKSNLGHENVF